MKIWDHKMVPSSNLTSATAPTQIHHLKFQKSLFSCATRKLSLLPFSIDYKNSPPSLKLEKFGSQERLSSSRETIELNLVKFWKTLYCSFSSLASIAKNWCDHIFIMTLLRWNSWTALIVEVSRHTLESSQTQVFVWFSTLILPFLRNAINEQTRAFLFYGFFVKDF